MSEPAEDGESPLRALVVAQVRAQLARYGLLLAADPVLPSVATIVAGGPIRGSWWGHPAGHAIFHTLEQLEEDSHLLFVKLVRGKVTLVDRILWPALFGVGLGREAWQMRALSPTARRLLVRLERGRNFGPDGLPLGFEAEPGELRCAIRELESRLLVVASSLHTSSGAHALKVESWEAVARARRWKGRPIPSPGGRAKLESAIRALAGRSDVRRLLPWPRDQRARPSLATSAGSAETSRRAARRWAPVTHARGRHP